MTYQRGPTPNSPAMIPGFLRKELEKLQRALAGVSPDWSGISGIPANVTAFAALVGAADTAPYFTGVGALALASQTPYARTILACANVAAARTALGLGVLAVLNAVDESDITLSDVTTNNVTTARHGFTPKAPNDASKFLDGTGTWSTPPTSGTGALPTFPSISNLVGRFSAEPTVSALTLNTDGRCAQLNDASGSWGSNFTAATTARPRWLKRAMNGARPGLVFDGTTAKMTASGTKTVAQPLTVVAVVQNWKGGSANGNLFRDSAGGCVTFISSANSWAMFAGSTLSSTAVYDQNVLMVPDGMIGAPTIIISVFNNASSVLSNNGVEITGTAGTTGISGTMKLGGDNTTSFAHMVLYEMLFFGKALSSAERTQINTYYATALDINL